MQTFNDAKNTYEIFRLFQWPRDQIVHIKQKTALKLGGKFIDGANNLLNQEVLKDSLG